MCKNMIGGEKMRKFLINLEVEKAFWVSPKNPDTYKSQGQ